MLDAIAAGLAPWYLYIKFVHVLFVMVWVWSTSHAYSYYLVPIFRAWRRHPHDPELIPLRNWAIERFDQGVILEHVAFPIILITGPMLYIAGGWSTAQDWLLLKLCIVVLVFVPIEVMDYHLSHLGGNKAKVRSSGNPEAYEQAVHLHWYFLLYSTAPIILCALFVVFLAMTKFQF